MYLRARRRVTEPPNDQTPEALQLSVKRVAPVLGTDFDVTVEVRAPSAAAAERFVRDV